VIVNELQSCMLIGLEEMEGKQQVYDDLANAIKSLDPAHTWTAKDGFVASGDARNITQGFLWRNDVTLIGSVTAVSGAPYTGWVADGTLDFVRTPPTGQFRFFSGTATPVDIRAYALHFKSKASSAACSTPDCTDRREKEAADLRDILAHHQSVGEYAVGGGDLNDFLGSSPINILDASPSIYGLFHDLPAGQRYSYIFNGESEVLDHVYVTRNLFATAGATWSRTFSPVHVNADFPSSEHASDHDPICARFGFYVDDGSGSPGADLTDLPLSYDLAWHKGPHTLYLGSSVTNDTTFAPGDDNASDDGVVRLLPAWQPGQQASIRVQVTGGSGWLSGWFDWNLDGCFDAGEKTVNQAVNAGLNTISFTIPSGAPVGTGTATQMPVRFRLYESGTEPTKPQPNRPQVQLLAAATGGVTGGEVEDYVWDFTPTAVTLRSFGARASAGWPAWAVTLVLGLELAGLTLYAYRRWAGKRSRPAL